MNERREPTISAPNKDELHPARASSSATSSGPRRPSAPAAQSPVARPVVAKSKLAPVAFFFALCGMAAAGFAYWQLTLTQQALAKADLRIADLESKFELSGDETTASTETIQAKLKWADSEIRKLWGVAHDTNRKAIAANKEAIEKTEKIAQSASKQVDAKVKQAISSVNAELKLLSDLVEAQQLSLTNIENSQAKFNSQAQTINQKLAELEKLEQRVKTNEQAIEAIDAFRRNVNQQILQLKGGA
ncbi:hypothetical protein TDB9533_00070 [Thalassocella blandensis]|nr:hypothetical protein TDB9533_00070 [Thalassocella blandensis]